MWALGSNPKLGAEQAGECERNSLEQNLEVHNRGLTGAATGAGGAFYPHERGHLGGVFNDDRNAWVLMLCENVGYTVASNGQTSQSCLKKQPKGSAPKCWGKTLQ